MIQALVRNKLKPHQSFHVGVAAEAHAAAAFALCGCDVSVQYGANQPGYDLIVAKNKKLVRVSVKGSQDGGWGLTQSYLKDAGYQAAIDSWLAKHDNRILFCFVQYKDINPITQMPRIYLAWANEVAKQLKLSRRGLGGTILYEQKKWSAKSCGAGSEEKIPDKWYFTKAKVDSVIKQA